MNTTQTLPLGQLVMTRGVNDAVADSAQLAAFTLRAIARHRHGDWGDLDPEDIASNNEARHRYERVFSAYQLPERLTKRLGTDRLWIITEADRSSTCLLWPHEY